MEKDFKGICNIVLLEEEREDELWIKFEMKYLKSKSIPHLNKMEMASLLEKCAKALTDELPENTFKIN